MGVDLAARNIVVYWYSSQPITTTQVCFAIQFFAWKKSFFPEIQIIHSNRDSIFSNAEYFHFLESLQIKRVSGSAKGHQNQVVERVNRTIKLKLRQALFPSWKTNGKRAKPFTEIKYHFEEFSALVNKNCEDLNQTTHRNLHGLLPNQIEEPLFLQHQGKRPKDVELIPVNDNCSQAALIPEYKEQIAQRHKKDWERFFIEWRMEQNKNHNEVIDTLIEGRKQAELRAQGALKRYQNLYHQHLKNQKQLEFLHQQTLQS